MNEERRGGWTEKRKEVREVTYEAMKWNESNRRQAMQKEKRMIREDDRNDLEFKQGK